MVIKVPYVSLTAPGHTTSAAITVTGRAPAGTTVRVSDGGYPLGEAVAPRYGTWRLDVTLADRGRPSRHFLWAEAQAGGETVTSAPFLVVLDASRPVIASMTMYQADGRRVTFDPANGVARFPYVFVPGMEFTFEIKFNDNMAVTDVQVFASGGGAADARFDGEKYVVTGRFGGWRAEPGTISVGYTILPRPYTPQPQPAEADLRAGMP